jgi:hypothetical protein
MTTRTKKLPAVDGAKAPLIRLVADFLNLDLNRLNLFAIRERLDDRMPLSDLEAVLMFYGDKYSGSSAWLRAVKKLQNEIRADLTAVLKPTPVLDIVVAELKWRAHKGIPLGHGRTWNAWLFAEMKNRNLSDKIPRLTAKEALQIPIGDMIVSAKNLKNIDWTRWAKAWQSSHSLDEPESDKAYHLKGLLKKLNGMDLRFDRSLRRWRYVRPDTEATGRPLKIDGEKWAVVEGQWGANPRQRLYGVLDSALRDGSFSRLAICRSCQRFFVRVKEGQFCCSMPCNVDFQNSRRLDEGYFKKLRMRKRQLKSAQERRKAESKR